MSSDLAHWERRLAGHFRELASRRSGVAGGRPIFALEHNLQPPEVEALCAAVRAHITQYEPCQEHALAWIVYAAEIGYRYSGDEYWQTFEQETPGWTVHGDRYWIRDCYRSFHQHYGGAKPSGAWADHFSIICWPITHAILPCDLQRQLARILYEMRHLFSAELFESPATLGEFIEARSWNATSRFQNLAQETLLLGQIAAALLLQGEETDSLVHPVTLERISNDLDRERRAREWLRSARRAARERPRIHGLVLGQRPSSSIAQLPEARAEIAALGIEPRLILRPTDIGGNAWEVSLEIPDLSHLLLRFPRTREILTSARCLVAGAAGRPLARGRCLHGAQRVVLRRWPRPEEVLLQFEQTDPQLDYLLRTECLLRPGSRWLFRIASDGLAYESRSLRVRPGQRYVLVSTGGPVPSTDLSRTIELQCDGAHGALLDLPSALSPAWEETLRLLGVTQAKTIEVWPAGLSAVLWDGEGHGEWLASERPCLALRVDHQIDGLLVSMDGGAEHPLELHPITPGEPVFVELPQLPVGLHRVRVSARTSPEAATEALGELDVVMRIREARPWSPGVSPHGPLIVQMEPPTPSLEQLWEGHVQLTIQGPIGRNVKCSVSLFEREGDPAILMKQLPPLRLPVLEDDWSAHFEKHFRKGDAEDAYDSTRTCELEFAVDELGAFTVRCDREFTPLRWVLRRRGQGYVVRLLNDSGDADSPVVTHVGFETPAVEKPIVLAPEYHAPTSGGMYVARLGQLTAAIIVPPVIRWLDDLGCSPRIDGGTRSVESMVHSLASAQQWGRARLPGDFLSAMRRREVLRALGSHATRLLCGDNWARAEEAARDVDDGLTRLQDAVSRRPNEVAIGVILARDHADLAAKACRERVERLASIATKYRILPFTATVDQDNARWLSELALRFASDPAGVGTWAGESLRAGLSRLMEAPTLARAARFLVLAVDRHHQSQASLAQLYAGWEWR